MRYLLLSDTHGKLGIINQLAAKVEQAFSVIDKIPETEARLGRGVKVPRWYSKMTHINLPDADVGYAVLDLTDGGAKIRTCAGSIGCQ
jgi:hypothetical protein